MSKAKQSWLFKTEPSTYSIDDLANEKDQTTSWEGVRNYQARNMIRDDVRLGDNVLVYHSNASPPAVVGTAMVVKAAFPDPSSWDVKSPYFDPKSSSEAPRWWMVDIQLRRAFSRPVGLPELRETAALQQMELLRKGSRLSVQRVTQQELAAILRMASRAMKKPFDKTT